MGKISSLQGMTQCRNAMQNRFSPHLRHRADALTVSVQPECASEKTTPQSACADSSPYAGAPMGAEQNLHRSIGKRQFCGFLRTFDTGLTHSPYRYSLNAPLKKTTPQSASLPAPLTQGSQGKCGAKSAPHYWEAAVLRFCRQFRYRADAICVSVAAPVRL